MSWKKRYNTVKVRPRNKDSEVASSADCHNNKSWLPQFYQGSYDRTSRYLQYDHMDYDVDINLALDTIAEFCTLTDEYTKLPFELHVSDELTGSDTAILREVLKRWIRINDFSSRLFDIVRNVIKYGDQVMIRDPETFKLHWVDIYNVTKVLVNEEEGKDPEYYFIKNLSFNLQDLVATDDSRILMNIPLAGAARPQRTPSQLINNFNSSSYTVKGDKINDIDQEYPVSASHIVHITKSTGMDSLWPFGRSVLDSVFKPFKQKELLEDAIIIYRVQRSPERLLFKIDTGGMSPKKANEYVKKTADAFRQKRTPLIDRSKGETIMDTTYNPMSITEDFFFAQGPDGRGSTVEVLPGGESTGSIEDLKFFTSRMIRGLRVPIAYMSYLTEDGQTYQYNDGKTGTAYMEEFKFSKYCERLQRQMIKTLNREFKLFVKSQDIEISSSDFDISFVKPQSFSEYRQIELDTAQMAVFQSVADVPYLSKRFIMKRFMGMTDTEIKENEKMWQEERGINIEITKSNMSDGGTAIPNQDEIEELEDDEEVLSAEENNDDMDVEFDFDEGDE